MSLLSSNEFQKFVAEIELLQEKMQDESRGIQHKIELAGAKVDYLLEKIQMESTKNETNGLEMIQKMQLQIKQVKSKNLKMSEKYKAGLESKKSDFVKQIEQIQQANRLSQQNRFKQLKQVQQKLDAQLKRAEKELQLDEKQEHSQLLKTQIALIKELQACEKTILANRSKIQESEKVLSEKMSEMYSDLHEKVEDLKINRKNRKINFLKLLEDVVVKIKQAQATQS